MFSTSGYFRGVTCPYYASGLCERPYCHFRHVRPSTPLSKDARSTSDVPVLDDADPAEALGGGRSGQSSSLLSMVGQAIKQVQRDIERDKATLSSIKKSPPIPSPAAVVTLGPASKPGAPVGGSGPCTYKPTPIAAATAGASSGSSTSNGSGLYGVRTTVPEYEPVKAKPQTALYKPTPIKLLKQKQQQRATSGNLPGGRYVIDDAELVDDNEYDPAVNFSTKGKGAAPKRPIEEGGDHGSDSKRARVEVEEAEQEAGQSPIDAAFSEDEEDNMKQANEKVDGRISAATTATTTTTNMATSDLQKTDKKDSEENTNGIFTMDVDAILGIGTADTDKTRTKKEKNKESKSSSRTSVEVTKSSASSKDKSKSAISGESKSKCKSKTASSSSEGRSKSDKETVEKSTEKLPQSHVGKDDLDKRNIFNIFDALSENSNDSAANGRRKEKDSNKENKQISEKDEKKVTEKESSSKSEQSSSHHRTHSSGDKKESRDKHHHDRHKSSSSSSSRSRHSSSHKKSSSSSHHRHRTSSGSSSSSKHSHKHSSSSSSHRHKTSSGSTHSKSSSRRSDSNHQSKAPPPSSSLSSSSTSDVKPAKDSVPVKGQTPRTERLVSHVDLFGEDSDDGSDDVMIVEPPKVDIPVVELSSEEEGEEADISVKKDLGTSSTKPILPPFSGTPFSWGHGNVSDGDGANSLLDSDEQQEEESETEEQLAALEESLDTEDTYDECLRIFNEESSRLPKTVIQPKAKVQETEEEEDPVPFLGRKRVARVTEKEAMITRKVQPKAGIRPSPAQVMQNRFLAMQKAAEAAATKDQVTTTGGRTRVAHVANTGRSSTMTDPEKVSTPVGTIAKEIGSDPVKRKAHVPGKSVLKRPTIPADFGSKVPTNIRQRYLNLFIDECLKIYTEEKDAFDRAMAEEAVVYGRSSGRNVYLNVAVNCIKKLRAEGPGTPGGLPPGRGAASPAKAAGRRPVSHEALLGGRLAARTSFTVKRSGPPPKVPDTLTDTDIYSNMVKYALTEQQLVENGFPRMSPDAPGTAIIESLDRSKKMIKSSNLNERLCVRCGKRFLLAPEGHYLVQEECIYHWGKAWKRKIGNSIENRYSCCQEDANSTGCSISKGHVHEQNKYENLKGYMKTMPKSPPLDGNYGVFALDCEMVYTTGGLELARITVINSRSDAVYEQLVKPAYPIIDPNTRFSGLKEEDFDGVTSTLRDIQAVLLSMFNDQTILVGHSLESDLTALKLIHKTVVDTSVVFPHRLGPPYKRALRTLSAEILQKIIQDSVDGHDSQEDAVAAMELMLWKIKEDTKKAKRR